MNFKFDKNFHDFLTHGFKKCGKLAKFDEKGKETECYYITKAYIISNRIQADMIYLNSMKEKTIRDICKLN